MLELCNVTLTNDQINLNHALYPENLKNIQNSYKYNLNNKTENEKIIQKNICDVISFIILNLFLIFICFLFFIFFNIIQFSLFLIIPILLSIYIIPNILYLSLNIKYIKLIKNESLNLLIVKKINYLNCAKSTFYFNLQNIILDIIKYKTYYNHEGLTSHSEHEALVITKIFDDNSEIDLNASNIKNKPIKNLYYIFNDLERKINTSQSLRNFIGFNIETENPINFNIYKYMGKTGNNPTFSKFNLSRYMKISEHFFIYFLEKSCCYIFFNKIQNLFVILFFSNCIFFIFFNSYIIILIINILILFIFIFFKVISNKNYSPRIDIIFSENFDTIFIALLNHNGTSYKKKFTYNIISIRQFIIENYMNSNNVSILKVIYGNKAIEDIFTIYENKYNLDGLLFILNEKLNKNQ